MPTIVFASPKGGVGKSTSAVVLATELARRGAGVTVIDADPNRPVSQWARRPACPESLTVLGDLFVTGRLLDSAPIAGLAVRTAQITKAPPPFRRPQERGVGSFRVSYPFQIAIG